MVKAVIFDCFGVVISDALSALCDELYVRSPDSVAEIKRLIHLVNRGAMPPKESSARAAQIFGLTVDEYHKRIAEGELKDQAVLDYILGLRKSYKTALLSNIPMGSLSRRFAEGELERYFDVVVVSGEIGYAKPDPEAYEITAEKLGVRPDECVFVDDRVRLVDGARAVGMQALLFQGLAQFRRDVEGLLANS